MQERWSLRGSNGITDGVDFVFLVVSLDTTKLNSLVQILNIVRTVPAKFCVLLSFLHIPNYRSLVFTVKCNIPRSYKSQKNSNPVS